MKANRTIWNRLVSALGSIMLLWALAPHHDCFCGTLHSNSGSASHECCRDKSDEPAEKNAGDDVSSHDCACCCLPERAVFRESRKQGSNPPAILANAPENALVDCIAQGMDQRAELRLAELRNDELKPSKIFLLKRALLE